MRTVRAALAGLVLALAVAACSGSAPAPQAPAEAVVVASFDFPESALLGELYAQALEHAGVPVRRELQLGPRELVLPALRQGLVDVVPEYLGSALAAVAPGERPAPASGALQAQLAAALRPDGLELLRPAAAQDQNGLAVTRATAERYRLRTTSDLRAVAPSLALAGPAECPHRAYCLQGLHRTYGLAFRAFVPYATEAQRLTALDQQLVDVAVVFTSDGLLAAGDLVLLTDDRGLQPREQVAPVVTGRALDRWGPRVARALDAVSARLDSPALSFLNWRVEVAGGDVHDEARAWLLRHALLPRP
ncbi:MAG: ABC transporter substrate-binding protein [Mycobacteriales bacterium]